MYKDTSYIPGLSVNIFSNMRSMKKIQREVRKRKSRTYENLKILKFEECLDYGNDDGYLLDTGIYTIPYDT